MLNKVFQLVRPRQFEPVFKEVSIGLNDTLVRPTHLSICHADQRYYQGKRAEEVLRQKLPMALIHEAIGEIVYDPSGRIPVKTPVVMVANTPCEKDTYIAENYLPSSQFRGSGFDGFMQEYICMSSDRILPLPSGINLDVATFTEMVSVSFHVISRFLSISHNRRDRIGIWGDGNLGYITAVLLHYILPNAKLIIFGAIDEKLNDFTFADEVYRVTDVDKCVYIDHGFECVGGAAASNAINQIIDHIRPEGTIALTGVSEDPPPINTRLILEKGLRIFGSSRSGRTDYEGVISLYSAHPQIVDRLEKIVGAEVPVYDIVDIVDAFEIDIHKNMGKTIMKWML